MKIDQEWKILKNGELWYDRLNSKELAMEEVDDLVFKADCLREELVVEKMTEEDIKIYDENYTFLEEKLYTKEDMINFAWYFFKDLGVYSNDEEAHFNGEYLKRWLNKNK